MYQIDLNQEQMERLVLIVAGHLDINIQDNLNRAMKACDENRVASLLHTKANDAEILKQIRNAVPVPQNRQ